MDEQSPSRKLTSMSTERFQLNHDLRRMSSKHQKQSKKTNSIPHGLEKMIVDLTANGIEPTDLVDILSDDDITLLLPP